MPSLVSLLVPFPLADSVFTYSVPPQMSDSVAIGSRVIIPFGRKDKFCTAIVVDFPLKAPEGVELKDILMVLDPHPILSHPQFKLWQWISDYYLCPLGDVYRAALPSGLRIESETVISLSPDFTADSDAELTEKEYKVVFMLREKGDMKLSALRLELGDADATRIVNALITKGILSVSEKLVERYRSRKVKLLRLVVPQDEAFASVTRSARQQQALMAFLALSRQTGSAEVSFDEVVAKAALPTTAPIADLRKKGVFELITREVNRFSFNGVAEPQLPQLSAAQRQALYEIEDSWKTHAVTLLNGVTSSGKTEIYIHLIDSALRAGKRAFFLVPEIALTTQLTERIQKVFGNRVLIYHSKFTDSERADVWKKLLSDSDPCVVIGARSAVFLPFRNLGLVIVDEEHEPSYKQTEPSPRYNARDVAIVLASMHGAKTVMGSATPSIETFYKAKQGKFGLVRLLTRYGDASLPQIVVSDIIAERAAGRWFTPFTSATIEAVRKAVAGHKQAILFRNRRGFAPVAQCKACAWVPKCDFCDVSMTYHKSAGQLVCHYCGAVKPLPKVCPQCGEPAVEIFGFGTERDEDAVAERIPEARILRMDLDTTRNKDGYQKIIADFSEHKADILVGTQMVTKGLDFANVEVVGVLNADSIINIPDFRSAERAFNMLSQVAGRAGRRAGSQGTVIIQTSQPTHPVIGFARNGDFDGFFEYELEERQRFAYPPFTRIISIYLKHRDKTDALVAANIMSERLRELFADRVLGPDQPPVGRVQALYIQRIMLKMETNVSMAKVKWLLTEVHHSLLDNPRFPKSLIIYYDVDPV
ncbi:MAG: primosomal protein N' [Muribaculaceae bacterium]|nr:primosomal protein N' [Muribaculaceae bacterium]